MKDGYVFKPFATNIYYKVSESGKIFYEQCMKEYCDPKKREHF